MNNLDNEYIGAEGEILELTAISRRFSLVFEVRNGAILGELDGFLGEISRSARINNPGPSAILAVRLR